MARPVSGASIGVFAFVCAAALAACGGGGGGGPQAPGVIPIMSASPCPSGYSGSPGACAQVQSDNSFTPLATSTTVPLPPLAGFSGTIAVPPAPAAGPIQVTDSTNNPGVTVLTSRVRGSALRIAAPNQVDTPLLYITFTAGSSPVSFQGFPGFTVTLPSSAGAGPFYLALLENVANGNGTWTTVAGPASPSGSTVTLQPSLPSLSIAPNASVYFVIYTGGTVPATAPTSSASPQAPVSSSPIASSSPNPSPTTSTSPGATSSPVSGSSASPSPVSSPTGAPTIPPTAAPTATSAPTTFPTAVPSATPTPATGTAAVPKSITIGSVPSATSGTPISFAQLSLSVFNASSAQITGTFANPVTVQSSDATGVVQLSVNGGAAGQSVTVNGGSDLVGLVYSGATINPVTITASASTVATPATATFTPAIASIGYSGPRNSSNNPEIDLYAPSGQGTGSTFTFSVSQSGYSGAFSAAVPTACNAFASVVNNNDGSFTVTAIAAPAAGSCTMVVNGFGTTTLSVKLTYTSLGVVLQ